MNTIDLHVHTTASDGTLSPAQVVSLASEQGLQAIAITDHDTVSGYAQAAEAAAELGLEVIPGIEVSTKWEGPIHILGYFIDPDSPQLVHTLQGLVEDRDARNEKMAALMATDGLSVSYEDMKVRFGPVIGRPHFGRILVELGLASSVSDAFDRYIEKGQKYYMPRSFLSLEESISLIRGAGGIAVLAHPFQYRRDDAGLRELIRRGISLGMEGMECRYSGYSPVQTAYLEALAEEYGLLKTGGSDFHGLSKPHIALGRGTAEEVLFVPGDYLQSLKERRP